MACTVTVTTSGSTEDVANGYTYDTSLTPEITDVTPTFGGSGGGTSITLTGTGFGWVMLVSDSQKLFHQRL